ncbi:MAG: GDSL family lipase, partial [Oscillospiraceae bacterium]|nr:GDSL family lipase [Oscillospiraceae bacterium]
MKIYPLIISALLFAGCAKAETPAQTDVQTTAQITVTTAAETTARVRSLDNVRPLGRTYDDGNVLWCGFSGTGAAFTVTGTKCTVTIAGCDNAAGMKDPPRIAIYRDGERVADELVDRMEKTYTVFEEDTEVTADIRIVKLSECAHSVCGIKSVDTDGTVAPAPARDMLIEFVGDSITCGYGVDDEVKEHHFSTSTEDCTKAYAIKTAEKLDADWSLVSLSGYGIISGYSDGKVQQKNQVIPKYYDKFGFSYSSFGGKKCDSIPWESAVHPDIVVINLGTNDASWVKTEPDRKEEFTKAYR